MIFVLTEDGYSYTKDNKFPGFGLTFWNKVEECLKGLNNTIINIKTSEGNASFIQKLESIYNENDIFILSFDQALDNEYVKFILDNVIMLIEQKKNIIMLDYICFEHLLATFKSLPLWVGLSDTKRHDFELFMIYFNLKQHDESFSEADVIMEQYCKKYKIKYPNYSEKLIKAVVADICKGINYFNIGKGADSIGKCWFCDCCIHSGLVYEHSKCGLKENRLTKIGKIIEIIKNTDIEKYLNQAGVEIIPLESEIEAYIMRSLLEENNEVL